MGEYKEAICDGCGRELNVGVPYIYTAIGWSDDGTKDVFRLCLIRCWAEWVHDDMEHWFDPEIKRMDEQVTA